MQLLAAFLGFFGFGVFALGAIGLAQGHAAGLTGIVLGAALVGVFSKVSDRFNW